MTHKAWELIKHLQDGGEIEQIDTGCIITKLAPIAGNMFVECPEKYRPYKQKHEVVLYRHTIKNITTGDIHKTLWINRKWSAVKCDYPDYVHLIKTETNTEIIDEEIGGN